MAFDSSSALLEKPVGFDASTAVEDTGFDASSALPEDSNAPSFTATMPVKIGQPIGTPQDFATFDPNTLLTAPDSPAPSRSVDTGLYKISYAKAAPTNAVPALNPINGEWTPEVIASQNARADEFNRPTESALRERSYNEALNPLFQLTQGPLKPKAPRELTEDERQKQQDAEKDAADGVENGPPKIVHTIFGDIPEPPQQEEQGLAGMGLGDTGIVTQVMDLPIFSGLIPRTGSAGVDALSTNVENLITPTNALIAIGLGGAPAALQKAASVYFAVEMGKGTVKQGKEAYTAYKEGDMDRAGAALVGAGFTGLMTAAAAAHVKSDADFILLSKTRDIISKAPDELLAVSLTDLNIVKNLHDDAPRIIIDELKRRADALAPNAAAAAESAGTAMPSGTAGLPARPNPYGFLDSQVIQDALDGKNGTIPNPTDRAAAIAELEKRQAKYAAGPPDPAATAVGVIKTAAAADAAGKPLEPPSPPPEAAPAPAHPLVGTTGTTPQQLTTTSQVHRVVTTVDSVEEGPVSERTGRPAVVVRLSGGKEVSVTYGKDKFGDVKPREQAIREALISFGFIENKPTPSKTLPKQTITEPLTATAAPAALEVASPVAPKHESVAEAAKDAADKEAYMGGPGAMGPVERADMEASQKVIGASKEMVTEQRAERGLDPLMSKARETNPVTWDAAVDRIEKDPGIPARLVEDIRSGEKKSTSREEKAELLYEMTDLTNKLKDETERSIDENSTPAERAEAQANAEGIERQLLRTEEAARMAGSDTGAALQFMQVLANENYTYSGLMMRERKLTGNVVPKERAQEIKKIADEYKKAQAELDALREVEVKRNEDAELNAKVDAYEKSLEAERNPNIPYSKAVLDWTEREIGRAHV